MISARGRHDRIVATAAVPLLLALLSAVQLATHLQATEFLVLPPLAVVIYLVFREPFGKSASPRSVLLLPPVAALIGQIVWRYFGLTPLGVAIATLAVLILQALLGADMPPALALAVLAMFLRAQGPWYVLGVLEGSLIIFIALVLWRRLAPAGWR